MLIKKSKDHFRYIKKVWGCWRKVGGARETPKYSQNQVQLKCPKMKVSHLKKIQRGFFLHLQTLLLYLQ